MGDNQQASLVCFASPSIIIRDQMWFTEEALLEDLWRHVDFFIIHKKYRDYNRLEEADRSKIARMIMNELLLSNFDRLLIKAEYEHLAQLIVKIFPTEAQETYYNPAADNIRQGGKLYAALMNFRTSLREYGLIDRRARLKQDTPLEDFSANTEETDGEIDYDNAVTMIITDKEELFNMWDKSYKLRKKFLRENNLEIYFDRYPNLNGEFGRQLVEFDAIKAQTLCQGFNKLVFHTFSERVIKVVFNGKCPKKLEYLKEIYIRNKDREDLCAVISLLILPHVFVLRPLKRKNSKGILCENNNEGTPSRSTTASSSYAFLPIFETEVEASKFFSKNKLVTPRIHLIGDLNKFELIKTCVVINNENFYFDDILEGFHFCFLSFFAFDVKYPNVSENIWILIQQVLYGINLQSDRQHEVGRNISFRKELLNIKVKN